MKSATELQQQLTQTIKAKRAIEKKLQQATNVLQIAHKKIQTLNKLLQEQNSESRYRSMMENMELGIMAVSYTHLDVYKRQMYACSSPNIRETMS